MRTEILDLPDLRKGDLALTPSHFRAQWSGQPVPLDPAGYIVVAAMARCPGRVFSRYDLLDVIGDEGERDERTMDSRVKRVRRAFRSVDPGFDHIETVYSLGYRWKE